MSVRERLLVAGWLTTFVIAAIAFLSMQGGNADSGELPSATQNEVVQSGQWPAELTAEATVGMIAQAVDEKASPELTVRTQPSRIEGIPPSNRVVTAIPPEPASPPDSISPATVNLVDPPDVTTPADSAALISVELLPVTDELAPVIEDDPPLDVSETPVEPEVVYVFPDGSPATVPGLLDQPPVLSVVPSYDDYDEHERREEHDDDDDDHDDHDDDDDDHERHERDDD